jgi:hypothetical protein
MSCMKDTSHPLERLPCWCSSCRYPCQYTNCSYQSLRYRVCKDLRQGILFNLYTPNKHFSHHRLCNLNQISCKKGISHPLERLPCWCSSCKYPYQYTNCSYRWRLHTESKHLRQRTLLGLCRWDMHPSPHRFCSLDQMNCKKDTSHPLEKLPCWCSSCRYPCQCTNCSCLWRLHRGCKHPHQWTLSGPYRLGKHPSRHRWYILYQTYYI